MDTWLIFENFKYSKSNNLQLSDDTNVIMSGSLHFWAYSVHIISKLFSSKLG